MENEQETLRPNQKAILKQLIGAFALYAVLMIVFSIFHSQVENDILLGVIALLPMPAILYGMWVFIKYLRTIDELQRQIQLEGLAISVGLTCAVTFAMGMLKVVGISTLDMLWVFPMQVVFWSFGVATATRKYM